jgi:hypothetical protein
MILLKTRQEHMDAVRRNRKHASDACPERLTVGEWILIQVTAGRPGNETHRVRYAMRFSRCRRDLTEETLRLFGQKWRYLIEGIEFRVLRHPFDIEKVKVSTANYGQGAIRFAYVDKADADAIAARNLLDGV